MPGTLFDTNVWLAAVFPSHPAHGLAQMALQAALSSEPAIFCRATEQSFLRLLTTPALQKAYGAPALSNRDALLTLQALQGLPQVRTLAEPAGTVVRWHSLAALHTASPKVWMDAYLAGFAMAGGLRLLTLDGDFAHWRDAGLLVNVLQA